MQGAIVLTNLSVSSWLNLFEEDYRWNNMINMDHVMLISTIDRSESAHIYENTFRKWKNICALVFHLRIRCLVFLPYEKMRRYTPFVFLCILYTYVYSFFSVSSRIVLTSFATLILCIFHIDFLYLLQRK